jgi:hypothetical protein
MAIGSVRISKDLWSFNTIEYAGLQRHPFTILTSGEAGLAQRVSTVSGIDVFAILGAGAATTGSSVGGSFAGGFLGMAHFRKWDVGLFARIQHTTGQQAGTTAKLGVVIGVGR